MRRWAFSTVVLALALSGCMTADQRKTADEERCRGYGFTKRNDAFAGCMQRIDMARRARLAGQPYIDGSYGRTVVFE